MIGFIKYLNLTLSLNCVLKLNLKREKIDCLVILPVNLYAHILPKTSCTRFTVALQILTYLDA